MLRFLLIFGLITINISAKSLPSEDNSFPTARHFEFVKRIYNKLKGAITNRYKNKENHAVGLEDSRGIELSGSDKDNYSDLTSESLDNNIHVNSDTIEVECLEKTKGLDLVRLENNKVYWYAKKLKFTWSDSAKECRKYGMHLASINTNMENIIVKDYIEREESFALDDDTWFALNGLDNDGIVKDEFTGLPPTFTEHNDDPWVFGQCGTIYFYQVGDLWWDKVSCDIELPFICEMDSICEKFV